MYTFCQRLEEYKWDPLELQAVSGYPVWVLGTKLRSSGREAFLTTAASLWPLEDSPHEPNSAHLLLSHTHWESVFRTKWAHILFRCLPVIKARLLSAGVAADQDCQACEALGFYLYPNCSSAWAVLLGPCPSPLLFWVDASLSVTRTWDSFTGEATSRKA